MNADTIKRFWRKVAKGTDCWVWTASKRHKGYGAFVWADEDGKVVQGRAHRFSWLIHNGPIPDGLCVLHHCDNVACVNPAHLFLGTRADNNRDMCDKGRHVPGGTHCGPGNYERGEGHHNARLTAEQVVELRRRFDAGEHPSALAVDFGICQTYAYKVATRRAWRHLP